MGSKDDWIKMRSSLFNHPNVLGMCIEMGGSKGFLDSNDNVTPSALRLVTIGGLCVTWSVVRHRGKPQENGDCVLEGATLDMIDLMTGVEGFGEAMRLCGWIEDTGQDIVFPGFFDDFNTIPKPPAKTPAERTRKCRENKKKRKCNADVTLVTTEKEKEKEIKKDSSTKSPKKKVFKPPTVDEVRAYCDERGNSLDAEQFVDHYTSNGWKVGGKAPMKCWRSAIRTWEKRHGNNGEGTPQGGRAGKTSAREHHQQVEDYLDGVIREEYGKGAI
jgi:hypothetical protein